MKTGRCAVSSIKKDGGKKKKEGGRENEVEGKVAEREKSGKGAVYSCNFFKTKLQNRMKTNTLLIVF